MRILSSALFCVVLLSTTIALAVPGTVRLKNGGWVEGDVLEVQPGQSVSIRIADGTVRQIPWAEVERVDEQAAPTAATAPATDPAAAPAPATEPAAPAKRSAPLSLDDPNVVHVVSAIDDRKLYVIGMPRSDASTVAIRLERFVREAQLDECKEMVITIDGTEARLPLQHQVVDDRFATREVVQVKVDLDTIKRMVAAKEVSFDMCSTRRKLTPMHNAPLKRFVAEFERNIGKPLITRAEPQRQAYEADAPPTRRSQRDENFAPPGYREHIGFMLRFTIGLGYGSMAETVEPDPAFFPGEDEVSLTVSGFAVPMSVDVGGAVADDVMLHARFSFFTMTSPSLKIEGEDIPVAEDASLSGLMLGAGLTHYFMPANVYLTGVLGVAAVSAASAANKSRTSDAGFAVNFDLGKEWWIGGDWGMGLAGRFYYSSTSLEIEQLGESSQSTVMFGVLMSATYQ